MKKHSLFKVIGITIIVAVLLTWIFPVTYYGYSLVEEARQQIGLFDFMSMGPTTFYYFGSIIFFILVVGGFYGVLHKTNGYRNLLNKIAEKFKGKEALYLGIVAVLFALITSMAGISAGLLFLFPFVISTIILMGYNKQTAALTTVGAVAIGLIGTTVSATNTNTIVSILGIEFSSELLSRGIILVLGLVLLIWNVIAYAKKHKLSQEELKAVEKELPVTNDPAKRTWPIILIFDLVLLVMILASISWENVLGIKLFNDVHTAVLGFKVSKFPIFAKILGESSILAFGNWGVYEYLIMLVLASLLIGLIYRVKFNDYIQSFYEGMKKAFKPAVLVFLAYFVLVITATRPVLLGIYKPLLTATKGFNVFTMSLIAFVNSIFNIEPYYIASSVLPYAVTVITDTEVYPLIAVVFQAMSGFATLIAPTSIVLIATLSYLDISFGQWIKTVWKLLLELLVVLLIIFTILILI